MKADRTPHMLKGNKSTQYPYNMIFFDIESKLEKNGIITEHVPYLYMGYYYRWRKAEKPTEDWSHFTNADDFWDWVCSKVNSKRNSLYMFAHNPSYDLIASAGIPCLNQRGFALTRYYEKGRTFIMRFQAEKRSIHILNVGNFYQGTVAQIGDAFGLPKMELDYDNPTIEEALPYCKRDVEIIAKAMLTWFEFCKANELGSFGKTVPKQAFNAYRHRFMDVPIFIHADEKALGLERESYYGGRTEVFRLGHIPEDVYVLDVNSMYPAVMKEFTYPYKIHAYRENLSVDGLQQVLAMDKYAVCATVKLKTDVPAFPCRINGRLIFPVGEFITTLTTPELKMAFAKAEVTGVYDVSIYLQHNLFSRYVDFFYQARKQAKLDGNKVNDMLYKLMLNSFYGKFGEKRGDWEIVGPTDKPGAGYEEIYSLTTHKWSWYKWFAGVMLYKEEDKEGYDSFPLISSEVTSYARAKLWGFIEQAGRDNVYYCDTDSLFVNRQGMENLAGWLDDNQLGYLKLEKTLHNLIIYGPKDYISIETERHKGVPKTAKRLDDNTWEYTSWPKISTMIKHNSLDKYFNMETRKTLKRHYLKGWVLDTGHTVPFQIAVDGDNYVVNWEDTCWSHKGLKLASEQQETWIVDYLPYQKAEVAKEKKANERMRKALDKNSKKQLRKIILEEGGIYDIDYEIIPRWAKRKAGRRLDELVLVLQEAGYQVSSADDVYDLVWQYA